jgi:hypothetical protein
MNAAAIPLGWGFRAVRRGRNDHRERVTALNALRTADPALLSLSPGLLARDVETATGVPYRVAYAAARDLRHARHA